MTIVNLMPFVKTTRGEIGIAEDGTFAARGWIVSDNVFDQMSGTKFSWYAPNGKSYIDHRDIFSRPTEQEVLTGLSAALKQKAVELGYISL